jgi:hypothetical protein
MNTFQTLSEFLAALNANHFAAVVLIAIVALTNPRPPRN